MGATRSQPSNNGGFFGSIGTNTVTFNTQNGALSHQSTNGNSSSSSEYLPGDNMDLGQYINAINQNMTAGKIQQPGVYPASATFLPFGAIGTQVGVNATNNALPSVVAYIVQNPPTRAVVYTNAQGVSNFCYRNDPSNLVHLVQNGSLIPAQGQQGVTENAVASGTSGPAMSECQRFQALQAQCAKVSSAPAPASGTSSFTSFGSQPSTVAYPMWVYIVTVFFLILAIFLAKKSK
jgi:hypothetical protein